MIIFVSVEEMRHLPCFDFFSIDFVCYENVYLYFFQLPCSIHFYVIHKTEAFFTYDIILFFYESGQPIAWLYPEIRGSSIESDGWFHETAVSSNCICIR